MKRKYKVIGVGVPVVAFLALAAWYLRRTSIPVLEPRGPVALHERHLMIITLLLSLIVVVPVFSLLFMISWRYREGNPRKAKYSPELAGSRIAETVWWLIPSAIIAVLAVIIWNSSHALDPFKPLDSSTPPVTIQVVALDWKWLFIYPQQGVAAVNYLPIPRQTPIDFQITSDSVMNSFWIPQLGSQIYAMPGMSTQLHLLASSDGNYYGSSANISGDGFAGMNFIAKATSASDFDQWVKSAKRSPTLTQSAYAQLAKPSQNNAVASYAAGPPNLYDTIINKYVAPIGGSSNMSGMAASSTPATSGGMSGMSGMGTR